MFKGKITKPEIWSKILNFYEISVLATGCGRKTSSDIAVEEVLDVLKIRKSFNHGQCIPGKGKRRRNKYFKKKLG